MAKRARKTPPVAAAAAGGAPDFDALLQSLMQSAANGSSNRWARVFNHLNTQPIGLGQLGVGNPLLIPLA
jgi:hypothetical protein